MSAAAADWLLRADGDWMDLVRFGPPGFEVHLRIDFEDEADAERTALEVLAAHTATPHTAYAAVWEGWIGTVSPPIAPRVPVPNRELLLFPATVAALRDVPATAWGVTAFGVAPHLAWPTDRAWCFACEVDEELAFSVGCSAAAAADLERALPGAVRRVAYGADEPLYRD